MKVKINFRAITYDKCEIRNKNLIKIEEINSIPLKYNRRMYAHITIKKCT